MINKQFSYFWLYVSYYMKGFQTKQLKSFNESFNYGSMICILSEQHKSSCKRSKFKQIRLHNWLKIETYVCLKNIGVQPLLCPPRPLSSSWSLSALPGLLTCWHSMQAMTSVSDLSVPILINLSLVYLPSAWWSSDSEWYQLNKCWRMRHGSANNIVYF